MKPLLPLSLATFAATLLLSGCPDSKVPKAPPKVPEPKAASGSAPASMHALHVPVNVPAPNPSTQA